MELLYFNKYAWYIVIREFAVDVIGILWVCLLCTLYNGHNLFNGHCPLRIFNNEKHF